DLRNRTVHLREQATLSGVEQHRLVIRDQVLVEAESRRAWNRERRVDPEDAGRNLLDVRAELRIGDHRIVPRWPRRRWYSSPRGKRLRDLLGRPPAHRIRDRHSLPRATSVAYDLDPRTEGGASRSCLDRCGSARTTSRRAPLHRRLPARPQPPYRPETTVRCSRRALEHVASATPLDVESSLPRDA